MESHKSEVVTLGMSLTCPFPGQLKESSFPGAVLANRYTLGGL